MPLDTWQEINRADRPTIRLELERLGVQYRRSEGGEDPKPFLASLLWRTKLDIKRRSKEKKYATHSRIPIRSRSYARAS